jgi:hypothetical protein
LLGSRSSRLYALALSESNIADELDKGYSSKLGAQLGWLLATAAGNFQLELQALDDVSGQQSESRSLSLHYHYSLNRELALRLGAQRDRFDGVEVDEWTAGVHLYF